jgi:hypothetical protein
MNHWIETSKRNLLHGSLSQNFKTALAEWSFTGEVRDGGSGNEEELVCELCAHPDLKAQYEIKNFETNKILWVGSSCILKFTEIAIFDANKKLLENPEEREQELKNRYQRYCNKLAVMPVRELWKLAPDLHEWLKPVGKAVKKGYPLSPETAALLFGYMDQHKLAYKPKLYKVSLQAFVDKFELERLTESEFELIKPTLSQSQIKSAMKKREAARG